MSQPRHSRILGTGSALPDKIVTNADLEKIMDTTDEWITSRTGIKERRIAGENEFLSDLALAASRRALEMAGVKPEELDLIVIGTVTPDQPMPATACQLQHALGAVNAAAFDLSAGCSGFMYALTIGDQFIRGGGAKKALIIGGEVLSKFVDWEDRSTAVIFADGCGAVVIGAETESDRGLLSTAIHADGAGFELIQTPGGGARHPASLESINNRLCKIKMKGSETFKIAVRSLVSVTEQCLENAGMHHSDISWYIPHQANLRIIQAVGERLELKPEQIFINIDKVGNTSAGSIPIALDQANRAGLLKPGDIVLSAAFGAGLTWGSALIRWG